MLQVWLPLNGDLDNQGLSDFTFNNSGAVIDNNGKIGKCYSLDGSSSLLYSVHDKSIWNHKPISIVVWFKCDQNRSSGIIVDIAADMTLGYYYNSNGIQFCYWRAWLNGSTRTGDTYADSTYYDATKWHHAVYVADGPMNYIYVDGQLSKSWDSSSKYTDNFIPLLGASYNRITIGTSAGNPNNRANGLINDIRIYNHALSPREIKELSKGLILHYPLADTYIEPTTNLISTEDGLSHTCYNASTSKYGYGTNTDIYKTVTTYDGRKGTKVYMGTNGNRCYPYVYVDNMFVSDGTNSPAYKTLSFDYYGTIGDFLGPYKLGNGSGTATYTVTCQGIKTTGTYNDMGTFAVTPNKWNHVEITFHGTTEADSQWGYIRIAGTHTSDTSNFWFFANMQLETNNHATGYAGPNGVRNENTVYDVSGYGHNGTASGVVYSADTPRYSMSTSFDGVDDYIQLPFNDVVINGDIFTINLWFKKESIGSKSYETLLGGPSGFEMDTRAGGTSTLSLYMAGTRGGSMYSPFSLNQWYMITLVNDGTNELYYVNGQLVKTIEKKSMPTGNYFLGAWYTKDKQNYKGLMSDFRIYKTALSADDIKALYQIPTSLSSDGTLFAGEFVEG